MDRKLALTILLNGVDKLSGPLRSVASQSKLAALAVRENRAQLRQLQAQANDISGFRKLKTSLSETEQMWKAAEQRAEALAREMRGLEQPTRAMSREFDKASREAAKLKQEHTDQASKLQTLRGRLSDAGISTRNLSEHERQLRNDMARTTREIDQQKDRLERLGRIQQQTNRMRQQADSAIAAGQQNVVQGTAIIAPFVLATRNAMEFSSGMVDLQQKAELTNAELLKMRGMILAASRATHQLPEDMRAAVDVLAGFGMDPRQAVMLTEPIGRLGTAFKVDLADGAASAYANFNNLKVPLAETAKAFDVMAAASNAGGFEVRDMARHFPGLTARMQALGETGVPAVADLSAALQVAMNTARDADEAGNNIANLLAKINAPGTVRAFQKNFGIDLPAALKKLEDQGMSSMEAFAVIAKQATGGDLKMLGWGVEDQQAQMGLLALIQGLDQYRKIRSDIANSGGTVDAAFDQRVANDAMVWWQAFKVQVGITALELGTKFLPVAMEFLTIAGGMASAVGDFAKENPRLTTGLLYLVAGTGAAKLALGGLQLAFGGIMGPATTAWSAYQKWKTAGSVAAAFPTAAGAMTKLKTAAFALGGGLKTGAIALSNAGRAALLAGGRFLKAGASYGIMAARFVAGKAAAAGTALISLGRAALVAGAGFAKAGLLMLANPMVLAITAIALGIGVAAYLIYTHWDSIKGAFDTAVGWIGSTWEWLKAKFMAAPALFGPLGLAAHFVITHWNSIKAGFVAGWNAVKGFMDGIPGTLKNIGRMMMAGLLASINPAALGARLIAMAKNGVAAFKNYLGIKSPSRLFAEMGGFMTEGLAIGLDRGAPGAVGAARRIALASAAAMTIAAPAPTLAEPQAPRLPIMDALRIQSAIAAPALPPLPRPDDLAIGADIAAPQAPRLPAMEALRIQSAVAAPALPRIPRPDDLTIGADIEQPVAPRLPALGRMRLPVNLDIARQLDLPDALMRVIPQLASVATLEARQEAMRPQTQLARPIAAPTREDRTPLRPSAPASATTINITIQQLPGEDGEALARRVADLIDRRSSNRRLGAYRDE